MAEKKTNRRAQKTKQAIFTALAELMCDKELRHITVQDISDKADIHRVTFYKHFLDIYDVYEQLETIILSDVGMIITEYGEKTSEELYRAVLKYIADHPAYCKLVFSPHNTGVLYQKLLKMFDGVRRLVLTEQLGIDFSDTNADTVIRYHANGCFSVISNWVMTGFEQPQSAIIQTLSWLDKNVQDYLGSRTKKQGR